MHRTPTARSSAAAACTAAALLAASASAAFTPTFQNRFTSANATLSIPGLGDPAQEQLSEDADDFTPFSSDLLASVTLGQLTATATAIQHTTIAPLAIFGNGLATALAPPTPTNGLAVVNASSRAGITFTIDAPTEVLFNATVFGDIDSNYVLFQGPGTVLASQFGPGSAHFAGIIQPGSYFLDVSFTVATFQNGGPGFNAQSGFDFSLTVIPAPATPALLAAAMLCATRRRRTP